MFRLIVSFLIVSQSLSAWWDAGHMTIAQIAYHELEPDVKDQVDQYMQVVSDPFPNHATFVTSSVWADDIIEEGVNAFWSWHGAAYPYDPDGVLTDAAQKEIIDNLDNNGIVWAINQCMRTLRNPNASAWSKGFMLRMLIHIVGDIHQPLHCASLYSKDFPKGDRAGTRFYIDHPNYRSLHQIFDGAFDLGGRRPQRPLTDEDQQFLDHLENKLTTAYPRSAFPQLCDQEIDHWRAESYQLAVDFAYHRMTPNGKVSDEVMQEGQLITGRQMTLAGYRLADLLNDALK